MRTFTLFYISSVLLAFCCAGVRSNDDSGIESMKVEMDNARQAIDVMRTAMQEQQEAWRGSAGSEQCGMVAADSLMSANKKATVTISGEFKLRYSLGFNSNYNNAAPQQTTGDGTNRRFTYAKWDLDKAKIAFNVTFSPDTMTYISTRPDRTSTDGEAAGGMLDEVWWQWKNIGGADLSMKVGYQTLDFGMFDSDVSPWTRVLLLDPYVQKQSSSNFAGESIAGITEHSPDTTATGLSASYWMFDKQIKMVAGMFASGKNNNMTEGYLGLTNSGSSRSLEISNHYMTMYYDPCWMEELHLQGGYMGLIDDGQGNSLTEYDSSAYNSQLFGGYQGGANYQPGFDLAVSYVADKWAVYGECFAVVNPGYYDKSLQYSFSVGADYALTEKFSVATGFDYYSSYSSFRYWEAQSDAGNSYGYGMRARLAARYDFNNGLYVGAEYNHSWQQTWGVGDSRCKDSDIVTLQTGLSF